MFIQILANGMIAFANLLEVDTNPLILYFSVISALRVYAVNGYKWQLPAFIMALLSVSTCWNIVSDIATKVPGLSL